MAGPRRAIRALLGLVAVVAALPFAAIALGIDVPDAALGVASLAFAFGILTSAFVGAVGRRAIIGLFGVLAGFVLAGYAAALVDPNPTDIPERSNLAFGFGVVGLWIVLAAAGSAEARRGWAILGGFGLFGGLVLELAVRPVDAPDELGRAAAVALASGLGMVALGAFRSAGATAVARPPTPGEAAAANAAADRWTRPFDEILPTLMTLAGVAAILGGLSRLLIVVAPPLHVVLQVAELVFAATYAWFVWRLTRAAPGIGAITGLHTALINFVLPQGLLASAIFGALALAPFDITTESERDPARVALAGLALMAISIARLGWVARRGPRAIGVIAGTALFVLAVIGASGPDPASASGLIVSVGVATAWSLSGLWLVATADRIRGLAPIQAFAAPSDVRLAASSRVQMAPRRPPPPSVGDGDESDLEDWELDEDLDGDGERGDARGPFDRWAPR
jgi:hypothetical protein